MKKSILSIGETLNKVEQISIKGGNPMLGDECSSFTVCYPGPIVGSPKFGDGCPFGEECVEYEFGAVCQCI